MVCVYGWCACVLKFLEVRCADEWLGYQGVGAVMTLSSGAGEFLLRDHSE